MNCPLCNCVLEETKRGEWRCPVCFQDLSGKELMNDALLTIEDEEILEDEQMFQRLMSLCKMLGLHSPYK